MPAIYGPRVANGWEGQEEEIHKNPNPLARFSFFMKEIAARSEQVSRLLEQTEAGVDTSGLRQPDCTVLLTVDEATLRQRMKNRPPQHQYESNPVFLLKVQPEFLRLIDREKTIIVDSSIQPVEEAARAILEELARRGFISSQFLQGE